MKYVSRSGNLAKIRSQCIVIPVFGGTALTMSEAGKSLNNASKGQINKILKRGDIKAKAGQTLLLHDVANINAQRVLLVCLGDLEEFDVAKFVVVSRAIISRLKPLSISNALICLTEIECAGHDVAWKIERLIESFAAGLYSFTAMKGEPVPDNDIQEIEFFAEKHLGEAVMVGIENGQALAKGMTLAKDVANTPGNICTPTYLAETAKQLCKGTKALSLSVLEEKDMEKLGMGALLSVSQGSVQPAKLITIQYRGAGKTTKPHVLVGKGITFDTGGISLKTPPTMHEMVYDMSGAASVLGTLAAVAGQQLPINVVGVLAAAENMPSGSATRPGDIVKTMSGQTVEILNTDAEGRLVLCDALTYIQKFDPESVIDIATLTGAIVTALGNVATGLFSNDDALADQISSAGDKVFDRTWRLPIWDDYQAQLASAFADMANIGGSPAGSITAACFLARFTKQYRWAHLDIAGTGYQGSGPGKGYTGRPIALLTQYLRDQV